MSIEDAENRLARMVAALSRRVRELLSSSMREMRTKDGKLLSNALNIIRANSAARAIRAEIIERGIGEIRIELRRRLDDIIRETSRQARDLGIDGMFTDASREAISALADSADQEIASLAGQASSRISAYLMRAVTAGGNRDDLLLDVQDILDVTTSQAETLIGTILNSFARQLTVMQASDNGIDEYAYVGPDDQVTRDWCSHWVGRRGTIDEFEETSDRWGRQSQPLPVIVYGGGYNCRHRFIPITSRNRDRYERGPR